jgi:hypothetical protein
VTIVSAPPDQRGFAVQPRRWVVEITQPHCPLPVPTVQDAGAWRGSFLFNQR